MNDAMDFLESVGEDEDEEWELIDARPYDEATEATQDALWAFASVKAPGAYPKAKSSQDGEFIKVRYAYKPASVGTGTKTDKSREFCTRMVAVNKLYRMEDIERASDRIVNPGFGPRGSDRYSIKNWKGGPNCYHFWQRQTFLKKDNSSISVNEARRIITALPVDERDANRLPTNDPLVAKRPIDMPNQGYLEPR